MFADFPESDWLPGAICVVAAADGSEAALTQAEAALVMQAVPRRRAHFAAGRACAHEALRRLGMPAVELLRTESGAPRWPAGCVGSISHCDRAAVALVASDEHWLALGIDVEPDQSLPDDVAGYAFGIDERARLARLPGGMDAWGLLAFCAKECVHKCVHPLRGAFLEFEDVEIDLDTGAARFAPRAMTAAARSALTGLHFEGRWQRHEGCVFVLLAVA